MPRSRHRDGRGRQAKYRRQMRRTNKSLKRTLHHIATNGRTAYATLLAVLAQKGGEITVTQGTLDQVNENFKQLAFRVDPILGTSPKEFTVRLIETPVETPGTDDAEGDEHADEHDGVADEATGSVPADL